MGMGRIRYLPILLLAADLTLMLATLIVAITSNTPAAARDVYAVLIAEFLTLWLLIAAQLYVDRIWPAVVEQPVHVVTAAPAVTVTRLAPPAHVSQPELVR